MHANEYHQSVELLTVLIDRNADHRMARMARGSAYLKMAETEKAVADFDHVIATDPADARAHHLRGLTREQGGDDHGALADINRAIELNPEYGAAYYSRSNLYAKLGEDDLALADIQTVTALTQVNAEAFANENNVWRSHQMRVESAMETELNR